ncbi:MAG: LuxR C-terminal-related transcriptional regulator [Kineosporiaceae bacterium]
MLRSRRDVDSDGPTSPAAGVEDLAEALQQAEELLQRVRGAVETAPGSLADAWPPPDAQQWLEPAVATARVVRCLIGVGLDCSGVAQALGRTRAGASVRVLATPDRLRVPGAVHCLDSVVAGGGTVRTCVQPIPLLLVILDGRVAFVQGTSCTAARVHGPPLLRTLTGLWEGLWASSQSVRRAPAPGVETLTSERHRTVLRLLAEGAKDESAARELGVSVRTYRRYVAVLMDDMGASTRFQAGAAAARWGWLPAESPAPGPARERGRSLTT